PEVAAAHHLEHRIPGRDDPLVLGTHDPCDLGDRRAAGIVGDDLGERLSPLDRLPGLGPEHHPVRMPQRGEGRDVVSGGRRRVLPDAFLVRQLAHGRSIGFRAQWRKCRRAVISIAPPARSTAGRISASRTEPPGWTIAVTPASSRISGPSANGKKAYEAATAPRAPAGACSRSAFSTAWRQASTRLTCPEPRPISWPSRTRTIAFETTPRTSRQA